MTHTDVDHADGCGRSTARARSASRPTGSEEQAPLSVGVDVVSVAEVAAAIARFGDRYIRRVFTPRETAYCKAATAEAGAARFAARFAAKEAAVKALEPTHRWSDWPAIEVRRARSGACAIVLHGDAARLAARRGVRHLALSLSHEGPLAAAVVVALRTPRAQKREHRHG